MALVAREGIVHISIPSFLAAALYVAGFPSGAAIAGMAAVSVALFFRDPERTHTASQGDILSPADGRIVAVDRGVEERHLGSEALRISVFMSIRPYQLC